MLLNEFYNFRFAIFLLLLFFNYLLDLFRRNSPSTLLCQFSIDECFALFPFFRNVKNNLILLDFSICKPIFGDLNN